MYAEDTIFDIESDVLLGRYKFVRTCLACPEQYDVFHGDEQVAYVRLRYGRLYASVPDVGGVEIYIAYPKGDGIFSDDEERSYHLNKIVKALNYHNS